MATFHPAVDTAYELDEYLYPENNSVPARVSPQLVALGLMLGAIVLMVAVLRPFALSPARPASTTQSEPAPLAPVAPVSVSGELWPLFTPEVLHWKDHILRWAAAYELDPNLVATVMQIESCGNPYALSSAGARGLFQVMPFHFQPGEDMNDPETNAMRGMRYLKGGLERANGDAGLALAGYNGGHSVITKGWSAWASETRRYYRWGSGMYGDATNGAAESAALSEWINVGGSGLCRQAHQALGL